MKVIFSLAAAAALLLTAGLPQPAEAGKDGYGKYRKGGYYGYRPSRKFGRGRRSSARRGGYSYEPEDTINTYGGSRTQFGSTNTYRDLSADRQTTSGPFDNGFFFDSGIEPNGGNSPYLN